MPAIWDIIPKNWVCTASIWVTFRRLSRTWRVSAPRRTSTTDCPTPLRRDVANGRGRKPTQKECRDAVFVFSRRFREYGNFRFTLIAASLHSETP